MSYVVACLVILASAVTAGVASFAIGRAMGDARRQHHEFGGQVFAQVGIMFSVLLSFVFSEVWSQYNIAAQAISHECGALHGAAMLAQTIPEGRGRPIDEAIGAYANTVVKDEWPTMADREHSPKATEAFRVLYDEAARLTPKQPSELALRGQIITLLSEAHAQREVRTFQITAALPGFIWGVLILMAIVLDGFLLFAGTETRSHIFLASAAAGCTAAALVMVRMLDYPFEGGLVLANGDFIKLAGQAARLATGT